MTAKEAAAVATGWWHEAVKPSVLIAALGLLSVGIAGLGSMFVGAKVAEAVSTISSAMSELRAQSLASVTAVRTDMQTAAAAIEARVRGLEVSDTGLQRELTRLAESSQENRERVDRESRERDAAQAQRISAIESRLQQTEAMVVELRADLRNIVAALNDIRDILRRQGYPGVPAPPAPRSVP